MCALGGGITSSGSAAWMRTNSSLVSGFPGAMATFPDFAGRRASSRTSRRRLALRCWASGPWQAKQCSERMGRMSWLNDSGRAGEGTEGVASAQSHCSKLVGRRKRTTTAADRSFGGFRVRIVLIGCTGRDGAQGPGMATVSGRRGNLSQIGELSQLGVSQGKSGRVARSWR